MACNSLMLFGLSTCWESSSPTDASFVSAVSRKRFSKSANVSTGKERIGGHYAAWLTSLPPPFRSFVFFSRANPPMEQL